MNRYQKHVSKICIAVVVLFTFCIKSLETQEYISYRTRPFVLDVEPTKLIQTPESKKFSIWIDYWPNVRKGYMFFLAELLTFYPDADLYFLARDAEYLYDIAMVLKQEIPQIQNEFHIIPMSSYITEPLSRKMARDYLQQEGLYSTNTRSKTALLVDTCCRGTVIDYIRSLFSEGENRSKVKGHLLSRHRVIDVDYPESKIFKNILDGKVMFIEDYPHYFDSYSQVYHKSNGKIEIMMSPIDNSLESSTAIQFMADIRHYFTQEQVKADFKDILQKMRVVFNYVTVREKINLKEARVALKALEQNHSIQPQYLLQDMMDYLEKDENWFKGKSVLDYIEYIYLLLRNQCVVALTSNPEKMRDQLFSVQQ